jgi:hypothetical protein
MMQSASDMFLGWNAAGFDVYVRRLRDMKVSAVVEGWDFDILQAYARLCAWGLAGRAASTTSMVARSNQLSSLAEAWNELISPNR